MAAVAPSDRIDVVVDLSEYVEGAGYVDPGVYLFQVEGGTRKPKVVEHKNKKGSSIVWACKIVDATPDNKDQVGKIITHRTNITGKAVGFTVEFLRALDPKKYAGLKPGPKMKLNLAPDIGKQFGGIVEDNEYDDEKTGEKRKNSRIGKVFDRAGFAKRVREYRENEASIAQAEEGLVEDEIDDASLEDPELE